MLLLGGSGQIVQIDESLFRNMVKVWLSPEVYLSSLENYQTHRGHPPRHDIWVFGMVDISHTPALGYMKVVPHRDATLLPIIQQHVRPGTVVHSDERAAYRQVQQLQPVTHHSTMNHSLTFIDPITGTHTHPIGIG